MKAKEISSVNYVASAHPQKSVAVFSKRPDNEVLEVVVDPNKGIFQDDAMEQTFTPSQWSENEYREATERDAAQGYCTIEKIEKDGNVVAYKVTRYFRRIAALGNNGPSVNSLLSKSRQINGHSTELADLDGLVFSRVGSEKDLQMQFLAAAKEHYKWTDTADVKIKLQYKGERTINITPKRAGAKPFPIKVQGWVFA